MKKIRALESWSKHNLPEDLWPEILSRLPVKSLAQFRSVSKSWRTLIDDPDFARLHLNQFKNNRHETHLFVSQGSDYHRDEKQCVVRCSKTFRITSRLGFLKSRKMSSNTFGNIPTLSSVEDWYVVSYVDGMIMLQESGDRNTPKLLLWNPSIRKARILPPSPVPSGMDTGGWGLGFDPSINDYKHVRFVGPYLGILSSIAIYTVGTNSWNTVPFQFQGKEFSIYRMEINLTPLNSICFKGVLYLIVRKLYSARFDCVDLVSFDLRTELFASNHMPVDDNLKLHDDPDEALTLTDGGCSLAVLLLSSNQQGSLWVLESFGTDIEPMAWTKRYSFCLGTSGSFKILYLKRNGELLLDYGKEVRCYSTETRDDKVVLKKSVNMKMVKTSGYVESLMLLKEK